MQWSLLWTLLEEGWLPLALPLALSSGRWSLVLTANPTTSQKRRPGRAVRHASSPSPSALGDVTWIMTVIAVFLVGGRQISAHPYVFVISVMMTVPMVALFFGRYATKKIGGLTGDTLGATCTLVELAVLLALVIVGAS